MRRWSPPGRSEKVLTRYTVKNGISNLYILLRSALKIQEMPFQRPKFQNGFQTYIFCSEVPSKCRKCRFRDPFPGGGLPRPPYNCVVTMVSPSLKSWLRHWAYYMPSACNYSGKIAGKLLRKLSGKLQFGYGVDYTIKDISFPTPKLYSFSILENLMSLDLH